MVRKSVEKNRAGKRVEDIKNEDNIGQKSRARNLSPESKSA